MQARARDKVGYYGSILLLHICMLALIWCVSPVQFMKPDTHVYAAPIVPTKPKRQILSGTPVEIILPSVAIDLPVELGQYDEATAEWTIASKKAFYATPTPPVNDASGNTLIYGHNNPKTLGHLKRLTTGDELIVRTDSGYTFHYTYEAAVEVQPTDTSLLTYNGSPIVTLQTCSGNWNEYRKLFQFRLLSVEKPEAAND